MKQGADMPMAGMPGRLLEEMLSGYPKLVPLRKALEAAFDLLVETFARGSKVLACGNGGSAADAGHIVGELMKGFLLSRPLPEEERTLLGPLGGRLQGALPAIALPQQTALVTACMNDLGPDTVYAQQVYGLGQAGDLLIAISTSGDSESVVQAAEVAVAKGLAVLALTGSSGGRLKGCSTVLLNVPERSTPAVQELHLPLYHALCAMVEAYFFAD